METLSKSPQVYGVSVSESIKHIGWGLIGLVGGCLEVVIFPSLALSFNLPIIVTILVEIVGTVIILSGLWYIGQVVYMWWSKPQITLDENGVALSSRRRTQHWNFTDFTEMQGWLVAFSATGTHTLATEGKWRFKSNKELLTVTALFENASGLCGVIVMQITTNLLPRYTAALERGERLEFGKLSLKDKTLFQGNTSIAIADIRRLGIVKKELFIESRSSRQPISINLEKTPNSPILLTIIQQIQREFPPTAEEAAQDSSRARNTAVQRKLSNYIVIVLIVISVLAIIIGITPHR